MSEQRCTCDVKPPRHDYAYGRGLSYAIYLDRFEDETRFDPACPFHGESGSMVVTVPIASAREEDTK